MDEICSRLATGFSVVNSATKEGRVSVPERREMQAGKVGALPPAPAPVVAVVAEALVELEALEELALTVTRLRQPATANTTRTPPDTRLMRERYTIDVPRLAWPAGL
jgi:hypothetical protein